MRVRYPNISHNPNFGHSFRLPAYTPEARGTVLYPDAFASAT